MKNMFESTGQFFFLAKKSSFCHDVLWCTLLYHAGPTMFFLVMEPFSGLFRPTVQSGLHQTRFRPYHAYVIRHSTVAGSRLFKGTVAWCGFWHSHLPKIKDKDFEISWFWSNVCRGLVSFVFSFFFVGKQILSNRAELIIFLATAMLVQLGS